MNAYFTIVILGIGLFFLVWGLGWLLERLSHLLLRTTQEPGTRSWFMLVGPGVALHETSHYLGCKVTRTEVVEFKPINIEVQNEQVILGYVKYRKPVSPLKNAIINLAPVMVSLLLLIIFALGATYLVPNSSGLGGDALELISNLINAKANLDAFYPVTLIAAFVYQFLYTFSELTVINPIFWIVAFLAMTIMFSNAPSDVDIGNAAAGLKAIIVFNLIWLLISYFLPDAGWILFGLYETLAVLFSLSLAFAAVGYGFFILIAAMSRLRSPLQIIPFVASLLTGAILWYLTGTGTLSLAMFSYALQTMISLGVFIGVTVIMMMSRSLRTSA
jgi:hypothetical protein